MEHEPKLNSMILKRLAHGRRPLIIACLALAYLVAVVFYPVWGFAFVDLDVPAHVIHNEQVHGLTLDNVVQILTSRGRTTSYYPIRSLSYAVDYQLWGLFPGGFKLTNVLIHLVNVWLTLWLILRLGWWWDEKTVTWKEATVAAVAVSLFAVHPLVVEPVCWVAGREELLMGLGVLGAMHCYVSGRIAQRQSQSKWLAGMWFAGSAVFCLIACGSNAVGAICPFILVVWDLASRPRPHWKSIAWASGVPWLIALTTIVVKRMGARKDLVARMMEIEQAGQLSAVIQKLGYDTDVVVGEVGTFTVERLMLVLNLYWVNLGSIVWPTALAVSYDPVTARSFAEPDVLLGTAALAVTVLAVWIVRRHRLAWFGLAWFLLALAPVSQLMPHHIFRADRFLYLPLMGLTLVVAAILYGIVGRIKQWWSGGLLVVAVASALWMLDTLSARQVQTWQNSLTMWENAVRVGPDNFIAHRTLAEQYAKLGLMDQAKPHYQKALELNAFNVKALSDFANYLAVAGDRSERDYDLAIRLAKWAGELCDWKDPEVVRTLATAYNNQAVDLGSEHKYAEAMECFQRAAETDATYAAPRWNLALLLITCPDPQLRNPQRAVTLAEQAAQVAGQPTANEWAILAMAYDQTGQKNEAVRAMERAIAVAEQSGQENLALRFKQQLQAYRQGLLPTTGAPLPQPTSPSGTSETSRDRLTPE